MKSDDQTFPYNRIIQWAAGPVASLAGLITAWLAVRVNFVGLHYDEVAKSVTAVGVFAVSAVVTYMAHHKWLDNLPKLMVGAQPPVSATAVTNFTGDTGATTVTSTLPVENLDEEDDVEGLDSSDVTG